MRLNYQSDIKTYQKYNNFSKTKILLKNLAILLIVNRIILVPKKIGNEKGIGGAYSFQKSG